MKPKKVARPNPLYAEPKHLIIEEDPLIEQDAPVESEEEVKGH